MSKQTVSAISQGASDAAAGPVVIIRDYYDSCNEDEGRKQKNTKSQVPRRKILRPESITLLDDMLYPLSREEFLHHHFRKNAVCIQRRLRPSQPQGKKPKRNDKDQTPSDCNGSRELVSYICHKYLFDLDIRQIFAETSSENVFLWLRPPTTSSSPNTLNSVEISDPDTAYALHQSGSHPAYCRAPPPLEQLLVRSLLRSTGLGGGHYHPPHSDAVSLGGGTTLGRGEVELFIGAKNPDGNSMNGKDLKNKHTTGAHTDFQENFTIQLSGIKEWTLRRGRVRHPLRATTPHYRREASVIENQLKMARLCCEAGDDANKAKGIYGFEYNDNNACGPEQTITLYPGDVLYFPSGMWHTVKTVEPGVSLNVSLMGTTYASLVCESLQHLLLGSDERWREVVTSRPGDVDGASHLQELMRGLSKTVDEFVSRGGGAQSVLPPALCHPPLENDDDTSGLDDGSVASEEENESMNVAGSSDSNVVEEVDNENNNSEGVDRSACLVVDMDQFKGPTGWSCNGRKLVKNPLASLISMEEVASHISDRGNKNGKSDTRKYILNVNFAGNEMCESHIRVILATEKYIDLMDRYMKHDVEDVDDTTHPECLFYYGFFSWAA
ncbi:hypothetical protein ACHAW6_013314 [Cyclotella cf. meneghiniana]